MHQFLTVSMAQFAIENSALLPSAATNTENRGIQKRRGVQTIGTNLQQSPGQVTN